MTALTPDITDQDIFVVAAAEYNIRKVDPYEWTGPVIFFRRRATLTASTKRLPAKSAGKIAGPTLYLPMVRCWPIDPVNAETQARIGLETPYGLWETFIEGNPYLHLYLEKVRKS